MDVFLTLALDVPRRLARAKVLWALVVVAGIFLLVGAASFGFAHDDKGEFITVFGFEFIRPLPGQDPATFRYEHATAYLTLVFAQGMASYMGVFAGLLLLADAVPSAFAPGSAEVNLPRPVHRGTIVVARHVGALLVAGGLATFLIGGAVAIVYVRTGVLSLAVLSAIPVTLLQFAVLHAAGTVTGLMFQNAFLGAVASAFLWGAGLLTSTVVEACEQYQALAGAASLNYKASLVELSGRIASVAHRALPRASDLPALVQRIPTRHLGTLPGGTAYEVELIVQTLVWTGVALGVATLIVRRRDY